MLERIISFSINNKFTIGLLTLFLIVYGIYSATTLPIDAVPDITNNQVQIYTITPSLAAQEVEQLITAPIERSLASIPGLTEVRSLSRFGLSLITVVFEDDVDIYFARSLIDQRINEVQNELPANSGKTKMGPVSSGLSEIYQYILEVTPEHTHKYSAMELREIQDWIIARQLIGIKGVAEVNSFGGFVRQFEVSVDPARLKSMGVTIPEIFNALEQNNENTGGAYIERNSTAYYIRGIGMVKSFDDIGAIVIKISDTGIPVLIRDVAELRNGSAIRYGALTSNGQGEVAGGVVMMLKDHNSAQVVTAIKDKLEVIASSLPEGITVKPFLDRSHLVDRALNTVKTNLIEGALIVIFILVLFLGNLRAGLIVASVIPLSMLFAIIGMKLFNVSGNLMSLGAIDFGLIVDGAVIIVESILHNIKSKDYLKQGISKLSKQQLNYEVKENASKMMSSATFGQIIILIVYIPILTLVGIEGKMFRPMAMTVSFAIAGALVLSLTYVPVMSALFLSRNISNKLHIGDRIMERIQKAYTPTLQVAIRYKYLAISASVIAFAASLVLFTKMGSEFLPTLEEGDFAFHSMLPEGSTIDMSVKNNKLVEDLLLQFPEVKSVVCKTGTAETPTDPMAPFDTDVIIVLKEKDDWVTTDSYQGLMDTMLVALQAGIPGVTFEATQPIEMRFNELMTGVRQDVAVKIFGENIDTLSAYAGLVAKQVTTIQGVQEPKVERTLGMPQIAIAFNRERVARYGLNIAEMNRIVRAAFAGEHIGYVYENERKFDIVVRLQKEKRSDIESVKNLFVPLPGGEQVPLYQVADISYIVGTNQISREEAQRRIVIGFNVSGRDIKSVVDEAKTLLETRIDLPPGYYFTYGGAFKNLEEATKRLLVAVPAALLLIFIILFITFDSMKKALLIYTAIPMSAIGGIIALWLRDLPFSISAGIGFIALFGVAVLNGIVLIATFNQLEQEGEHDIIKRVIKGTSMRLRPVLMTAFVASLGFLPMAMSETAGAEVQRPLATVVIGGLITATALTLVILPLIYILFSGKFSGKKISALIVAACTLIPFTSHSQQTPLQIALDLETCVSMALERNQQLAISMLDVEQKRKLQKTSFDFGRTGIFYENEDLINNSTSEGIQKIGFTQSIPFPSVWFAQGNYNKQSTYLSSLELENKKLIVKNLVKSSYYELCFAIRKQEEWKQQDSLFSQFKNASSIRYQTGESSKLESMMAQAKLSRIKIALNESTTELNRIQQHLMNLLNTDSLILPSSTDLEDVTVSGQALEKPGSDHVYLEIWQAEQIKARDNKRIEIHKLFPDLTIRYFNQNWYNTEPGYYGYSFGIGIPLFFWSQQGRIQAAAIEEDKTVIEYNVREREFKAGHTLALSQYNNSLMTLQFYRSEGIEQAKKMQHDAVVAFKSGEIGYIELVSLLSQAHELRLGYLDAWNECNQSAIKLNYYNGQ